MFHPAELRPGMYAGVQGDRTREEWVADAVAQYEDSSEPMIDMDTNRPVRRTRDG